MNGMELSEQYFSEICAPMISQRFPEYRGRIAAGLVGQGSECFGFDDEISRDHDWGPACCLWLTKNDHEAIGARLQNEVSRLPGEFAGFKARSDSRWGEGRTGVFEIGAFYKQFISFDHVPQTLMEWRLIPETHMAVATNGKVFTDPAGEFTAFRDKLKAFYPEDIRLKKIASRCMTIAQSGQYNYIRCIKRDERVAARLAEAQFMSDITSMVFLLNRQYKPFYKWMHRAMKKLPILGNTIHQLLFNLVTVNEMESSIIVGQKKNRIIEEACQHVIEELKRQGLSDSEGDFLLDHGPIVQSKIQDRQIRSMNVWVE